MCFSFNSIRPVLRMCCNSIVALFTWPHLISFPVRGPAALWHHQRHDGREGQSILQDLLALRHTARQSGESVSVLAISTFQTFFKFYFTVLVQVSFVWSLIEYQPLTFNRWYVYPAWAYVLGWLLALSSILLVPGWALYKLGTGTGSLSQVGLPVNSTFKN